MLLDLVVAEREARWAASTLCVAASAPPTTALRWIAAMTEQGLFRRQADSDDGRPMFNMLTASASAAMAAYLAGARRVLKPWKDHGGGR